MTVTHLNVNDIRTPRGGIRSETAEILGIDPWGNTGWLQRLVGTQINDEVWNRAVASARLGKKRPEKQRPVKRRRLKLAPVEPHSLPDGSQVLVSHPSLDGRRVWVLATATCGVLFVDDDPETPVDMRRCDGIYRLP